jgi:hypothetical protein
MKDNITDKVTVAEFGLGTPLHFDFENILLNNNIEFEIQTRTVYSDSLGLDVISFLVSTHDLEKANELKKKVVSTRRKYKAYPKFMKIFWIVFVSGILLMIALFFLFYYQIIT